MSAKESGVDLDDDLVRGFELGEETGDEEVGGLRSDNIVEPDADPTESDNVLLRFARGDEPGKIANELSRHVTKFDSKFLLIESSEIRCSCKERLPDLLVYLPDPFEVD